MSVCQAFLNMSDLGRIFCCILALALSLSLFRKVLFEKLDIADSRKVEDLECSG